MISPLPHTLPVCLLNVSLASFKFTVWSLLGAYRVLFSTVLAEPSCMQNIVHVFDYFWHKRVGKIRSQIGP